MVIIDGSFLLGIAAVLSSIATLWRAFRERPAWSCPNQGVCSRRSCRTSAGIAIYRRDRAPRG